MLIQLVINIQTNEEKRLKERGELQAELRQAELRGDAIDIDFLRELDTRMSERDEEETLRQAVADSEQQRIDREIEGAI
eukprot:69577-Pyramimonas_sp.AAC.1